MIKIMQNGIKHDNGYTPCFYSMGNSTKYSDRCITIYSRSILKDLPAELGNVENDTDGQTDYFESDRCTLEPGDRYYNEALAAYNKRRLADSKRWLKHEEKKLAMELTKQHPHEATVCNLKSSIENYRLTIAALSA